MSQIVSASFDIGHIDILANQDTIVHRLDPRAKVISTLVYIVSILSFNKYSVSQLLPYFIYPVLLIALGNLPIKYFLKKLVIVLPFVFFVAIFNPFLDKEPFIQVGSLSISGGWVSFISIILRFVLTVGAALILVAVTGFTAVCMALDKLGTPTIFTLQLLFLYRFLFVLVDEGARMFRAYSLRSFTSKSMPIKVFGQLIGNLLLRTIDRAQRTHMAMLCRGFNGKIQIMHQFYFSTVEVIFTAGCCFLFLYLRFYNFPQIIGNFFIGIL